LTVSTILYACFKVDQPTFNDPTHNLDSNFQHQSFEENVINKPAWKYQQPNNGIMLDQSNETEQVNIKIIFLHDARLFLFFFF
jgi:hypothetical protein